MTFGDFVFAAQSSSEIGRILRFLMLTLQSPLFWVPLLCLLVLLVIAFRRSQPLTRHKYVLLSALPAIWIFVAAWGAHFRLDGSAKPFVPNPLWVRDTILASDLVFVLVGIILTAYLRGARAFTAVFVVINAFFLAAMSAFALNAVTSVWN